MLGSRLFDKSPAPAFHRVGIVETQNSPIAGIVQRQLLHRLGAVIAPRKHMGMTACDCL